MRLLAYIAAGAPVSIPADDSEPLPPIQWGEHEG